MKTLLFCASFAESQGLWNHRWKRWLDYHTSIGLEFDQVLIVDDGSPTLPRDIDCEVIYDLADVQPEHKVVLFHHNDNLGSPAPFEYPGLFRSMQTATDYAAKYNFDKIVNIESDAFVLSDRVTEYINNINDDWTALWDHHFAIPELGINIAAGRGLELWSSVFNQPYDRFRGKMLEEELPFTRVEKNFTGARYGEFVDSIPEHADYATQIDQLWNTIRKK